MLIPWKKDFVICSKRNSTRDSLQELYFAFSNEFILYHESHINELKQKWVSVLLLSDENDNVINVDF